jgi:hypothetical protein
MPVPSDVVKALLEWRSMTPYDSEDDWVFASASRGGKLPVGATYMFCCTIRPLAVEAGLPTDITWYSLRHSLNGWCKECISREDRKILLRHKSDKVNEGYGEPGLDRKREIQEAVVQYVKARASASGTKKQPRHASNRKKLHLVGVSR